MHEYTKAQTGRSAIRAFQVTADALVLRGYYKPSGRSGHTLENALRTLSPEIYGTLNHPRSTELKGLEYVLERLPCGIENCSRIVLTAREDFDQTTFERVVPPKRRRLTYRVSPEEICFVITRGISEIYDILTHVTFLTIEARKVFANMRDLRGEPTTEWQLLEALQQGDQPPSGRELDQALWHMGILLGRTYRETRATYEYLEESRRTHGSNSGLFAVIHGLASRVARERQDPRRELVITFTPDLQDLIGHHTYGRRWAQTIKERLREAGLTRRPLHIISANLHSVLNLIYGFAATEPPDTATDLYTFVEHLRSQEKRVRRFAEERGLHWVRDRSGAYVDAQIIDTTALEAVVPHPAVGLGPIPQADRAPVILVLDYAFGFQAYEIMDELLVPLDAPEGARALNVQSISIMGKAGTLPGHKGDIMLATAHVMEGTPHNYIVPNELTAADFGRELPVHVGPMLTVLGTSLQNRDVLRKFQESSWGVVGLEMEGGHYQRAISGAIIRGHIQPGVRVRYAYYASDNPMVSGQTLATGGMGLEGIKPTYLITKIILEKILGPQAARPAGR